MEFVIDRSPPGEEAIQTEKEKIQAEISKIKQRDTIISFTIMLFVSIGMGLTIYWVIGDIRYALVAVSVIPIMAVGMHLLGFATNMGFRSAEKRLNELNYELVALTPIAEKNSDITNLSNKYKEVGEYRERAKEVGRHLVNGELAMFWDYDASTMAKQDKAKAYVEQAKRSVEVK